MKQQVYNFDGSISDFEALHGSDVWPFPLAPTTIPFHSSRNQFVQKVYKYGLLLELDKSTARVHGKLFWDDIVNNINSACQYIEGADAIVKRIILSPIDLERFVDCCSDLVNKTDQGMFMWSCKIISRDIEQGRYVCEADLTP